MARKKRKKKVLDGHESLELRSKAEGQTDGDMGRWRQTDRHTERRRDEQKNVPIDSLDMMLDR